MSHFTTNLSLSEKALKDLEEALDDVKHGRLYSHEDVKKMTGLE